MTFAFVQEQSFNEERKRKKMQYSTSVFFDCLNRHLPFFISSPQTFEFLKILNAFLCISVAINMAPVYFHLCIAFILILFLIFREFLCIFSHLKQIKQTLNYRMIGREERVRPCVVKSKICILKSFRTSALRNFSILKYKVTT